MEFWFSIKVRQVKVKANKKKGERSCECSDSPSLTAPARQVREWLFI
jgi:hypothetical protein